jgi:hypothetical protein
MPLDSAMNEEVNFCSQCGATVNLDAKFCSSCGHDLTNSSTKITPDKTVKVEVTNVTVEKGFKAIEKGVKATPSMINGVWYYLKPLLIVGALLFGIASALNYAGYFRGF